MRILVVSTLYPPVAFGGYEVECSAVVERLAEHHQVRVLTSRGGRRKSPSRTETSEANTPPEAEMPAAETQKAETPKTEPADVWRELALLDGDARGALRAPMAALAGVRVARRALRFEPDLVYVWNASQLPQAALRVLADSGVPFAVRVCEHWFGRLFVDDQFMRELLPQRRRSPRAAWSAGCRALNALPALRLDPCRPLRAAISWNSEAIRRMAGVPPMVEPVLEQVCHSVPRYGDVYAQAQRLAPPTTEPAGAPTAGSTTTERAGAPIAGRAGVPAAEREGSPTVAFLGRVIEYKGLAVAIEALARLREEHGISARLVVMGPEDAGYGTQMRALAQRLGLSRAIDWRGQTASEQAAAELARADLMIVPSLWPEPFPLVTIEGAFARVPLVASDVGGIGEGMHHEEHALLFARGDSAAAAAAMARTLSRPQETAARVQRARERAEQFRLGPYLDAQDRFVWEAHAALTGSA